MKIIFICFFVSIVMLLACSTSKPADSNRDPNIVKATYHHWHHAPMHHSTVPEGGADLTLLVKNWPRHATPSSIIWNHIPSLQPTIADTTDVGVVIKARVVVTSSVLQNLPKKTEKSDRLIYQTADSTSHFIKIDHWQEAKN